MQKLINNRLFRIVGIIAILYYGLLHDKTNPDSLGNRLSPENLKTNINEASKKGVEVMSNIKKAEEIKKNRVNQFNNDQSIPDNKDDEQQNQ